jgi:hypothetical protein
MTSSKPRSETAQPDRSASRASDHFVFERLRGRNAAQPRPFPCRHPDMFVVGLISPNIKDLYDEDYFHLFDFATQGGSLRTRPFVSNPEREPRRRR